MLLILTPRCSSYPQHNDGTKSGLKVNEYIGSWTRMDFFENIWVSCIWKLEWQFDNRVFVVLNWVKLIYSSNYFQLLRFINLTIALTSTPLHHIQVYRLLLQHTTIEVYVSGISPGDSQHCVFCVKWHIQLNIDTLGSIQALIWVTRLH